MMAKRLDHRRINRDTVACDNRLKSENERENDPSPNEYGAQRPEISSRLTPPLLRFGLHTCTLSPHLMVYAESLFAILL